MASTSIVTVMTVVVVAVVAVIVMAVVAIVVMAVVASMVTASVLSASMSTGELFSGFYRAKESDNLGHVLLIAFVCFRNLPSAKTQTAQRRVRRKMAFMILRWNNKLNVVRTRAKAPFCNAL